jgi:hypothetical protein
MKQFFQSFASNLSARLCLGSLMALMVLGGARTVAAATATLSVTTGGGGTVSPNYNGQNLTVGQIYSLTAKPKSGFAFDSWSGSTNTSAKKITFTMADGLAFTASFNDAQKPTLKVQSPGNKITVTNGDLTMTGTAKDNAAVAAVLYQLNDGDWLPASTGNGWSNWWVTVSLAPGANVLLAYAADAADHFSVTNKRTVIYSAMPKSLSGQTAIISPDGADNFTLSFDATTFSQTAGDTNFDNGVGTYTFIKTGPNTGKLVTHFTAPPSTAGDVQTAFLQFTNRDAGSFTNGDATTSAFHLTSTSNSVLLTLAGANLNLMSGGGDSQQLLMFVAQPTIVDNGHMFNVANPLLISLDAAYAGGTGDRVSVLFTHLKNISGQWVQVNSPTYAGTVIAIGTDDADTNTVTVLFDSSAFISKTDLYAPANGSLLNVLTFYYTNFSEGSVTAAGTGTYTFVPYSPVAGLLKLNETNGNSAIVLTFDDDTDSGTNSGTYYGDFIDSAAGSTNTGMGTFGIVAPPTITTQPQNTSTTNGGDATFTVTASGSAPLDYQWQKNGTNVTDDVTFSGSTSNHLALTGVTTNDLGNYRVIVVNDFGSVTSSVATLTIAPVKITSQPQSVTTTNGGSASFSVTATGSGSLTYQWQKESVSLSDNGVVAGSATSALSLTNVTTIDAGHYRVIVDSSFGSVTSSVATLTISTNSVP